MSCTQTSCLNSFSSVNPGLVDAVHTVLQRHGWSFVERLMGAPLFSKYVSDDEKSRIASRILTLGESTPEVGKPRLPSIDGFKPLADYVGPETPVFFDLIGKLLGTQNRMYAYTDQSIQSGLLHECSLNCK